MTIVNYEQVLRIIENCAEKNMSVREVYNLIVFVFGQPEKPDRELGK